MPNASKDTSLPTKIPKASEVTLSEEMTKRISDLSEGDPNAAAVLEALVRNHERLNPDTSEEGMWLFKSFGISAAYWYTNADPLKLIDKLIEDGVMSGGADIWLIHKGANNGKEDINESSIVRTFDSILVRGLAERVLRRQKEEHGGQE